MRSMPAITVAGGAAPATIAFTLSEIPSRSAGSELLMRLSSIGALQKCVTFSLRIRSRIGSTRTARRQTDVPATAARVQGKHQLLQWNIGKVQRQTGAPIISHLKAFETPLRQALR